MPPVDQQEVEDAQRLVDALLAVVDHFKDVRDSPVGAAMRDILNGSTAVLNALRIRPDADTPNPPTEPVEQSSPPWGSPGSPVDRDARAQVGVAVRLELFDEGAGPDGRVGLEQREQDSVDRGQR